MKKGLMSSCFFHLDALHGDGVDDVEKGVEGVGDELAERRLVHERERSLSFGFITSVYLES